MNFLNSKKLGKTSYSLTYIRRTGAFTLNQSIKIIVTI